MRSAKMDESIQKILIGLAGGALTGLVAWAGLALRKAARNVGRTEVELAIDELKDALAEERRAKKTPGKDDDAAAAEHVRLTKKRVEKAKRLKALLDAAGSDIDDVKVSE